MRKKNRIWYKVIGVLLALILINSLGNTLFFRFDFTADQKYTLSRATKRILKEVKEPIIISLYISDGLPPDVSRMVRDFKNLLKEYNSYSKYRIEFEEINPNKNKELEQEAIAAGIRPVPLEVREKDQLKVQKVFLGTSIQVGARSEVIPLIKPGIAMEYTLSSLIKKLTISHKHEIGYIQGHGEAPLLSLAQASEELSLLYQIKRVNLSTDLDLSRYKSLMIVGPVDSFPPRDLKRLDNYLANGGNLMIALDRVQGLLNQGMGIAINTGLEKWLEAKGLKVEEAFVVDKKCGNVTVHQQQGIFSYNQEVSFPFLPVITEFSDHVITDGLEAVILQFASPITYTGSSDVKYSPLAWTSSISGKLSAPLSFNLGRNWRGSDFLFPEQTVAAMLEGPIVGEKDSKIVVVGDGNFVVNGMGEELIPIQTDNIHFLVNAVDWLSDDSGLLTLRTKGISSRPLDELEDGQILFLKYLNFLLPIISIIIFGLLRFNQSRIRRLKRMKPGYIQ
ncbi:MAG: GldG family protein [Marinifilaceae bacterium]